MPRQISITRNRILNLFRQTIRILPIFKPIVSVSPESSAGNVPQLSPTLSDESDASGKYLPGDEITVAQIEYMQELYKEYRLDPIKKYVYGHHSDADPANRIDLAKNDEFGFPTNPNSRGIPEDTQSCWFSKEIIQQLIAPDDCLGIRIYYGVYGVKDEESQLPKKSPKNGYHNAILVGLRLRAELKAKLIGQAELVKKDKGGLDVELSEKEKEAIIDSFLSNQVPDNFENPGEFYTLFEDMLGDDDQVAVPGRFHPEPNILSRTAEPKTTPPQNLAYDFGGLGPPMKSPISKLK